MYTLSTDVTVLKHATERIFRAMSQRDEIIEKIYDFIHCSESNEMYSVMAELVNRLGDNIKAERRSEDETWFDGLRQSFNTKEDFMRNAAKSRVRKYFSDAKESFEKVSSFLLSAQFFTTMYMYMYMYSSCINFFICTKILTVKGRCLLMGFSTLPLERLSMTLRQMANGKNETFAVRLQLSVQ